MASFGIGSNILGGAGPDISAGLQSRRLGDPVSALSQVSPVSPAGQNAPLPIPMSQLPSSPMPVGQVQQKAPQSESEMIVKALVSRLKTLSNGMGGVTQL